LYEIIVVLKTTSSDVVFFICLLGCFVVQAKDAIIEEIKHWR